MGMALTSCTVPAAGKPTFELGDDEIRDRHRHPRRAGPRAQEARSPSHDIVEQMATAVVDDLPFGKGDEVLAFVNGMGAPR